MWRDTKNTLEEEGNEEKGKGASRTEASKQNKGGKQKTGAAWPEEEGAAVKEEEEKIRGQENKDRFEEEEEEKGKEKGYFKMNTHIWVGGNLHCIPQFPYGAHIGKERRNKS